MSTRRAFLHALGFLGITPSAGPPPADSPPARRRTPRGRHAIYVGTPPEGFQPASAADCPLAFHGPVSLLSTRHSLQGAARLAHRHNREQVLSGRPVEKWAFVVALCREEKHLAEGGEA